MKKTKLTFALLLLLITVCLFGFFPRKSFKNKNKISQVINDSVPILLMGSFLDNQDDYPLDTIRIKLMNGSISCTAGLEDILKKYFSLSVKPKTITLDQFNFQDNKSLVFTELDSIDARFHCKSINGMQFFYNHTNYPFWKPTVNRNFVYENHITHYIHTGVTAITRSTGTILNKQGIDWYLSNIQSYFNNAELVHISNEVSMQDTCNYATMKYKFATLSEHMEILKRLKASVIELTGNHNLDFGKDAYLKSLEWYKKNNIDYFGGGGNPDEAAKPLVRTLKDGNKIAWVGFNQACPLGECTDNNNMGAMRYNEPQARTIIDSLKKKAHVKYIIACVQFTEMDSYTPNDTQKKIAQNLIDMGADVVLGSQAHQPQEISIYHGKPIFYGLGNFLFDQIHRVGVRQAFFLNCYFFKGHIIQFLPVYTFMSANRQPTIATAEEKKLIQSEIIKKSNF